MEDFRESLLLEFQEANFGEDAIMNESELIELEDFLRSPGINVDSEVLPAEDFLDLPERKYASPSATSLAIQSKFLSMGTPVSIRYSSYNSLPNLEKFATNMDDLELFENLPNNSTGVYHKIKSLLKKMRPGGRVSKPPKLFKLNSIHWRMCSTNQFYYSAEEYGKINFPRAWRENQ